MCRDCKDHFKPQSPLLLGDKTAGEVRAVCGSTVFDRRFSQCVHQGQVCEE